VQCDLHDCHHHLPRPLQRQDSRNPSPCHLLTPSEALSSSQEGRGGLKYYHTESSIKSHEAAIRRGEKKDRDNTQEEGRKKGQRPREQRKQGHKGKKPKTEKNPESKGRNQRRTREGSSKNKRVEQEQKGVVQSRCYSRSSPPAALADEVSSLFPPLHFNYLVTVELAGKSQSGYWFGPGIGLGCWV